MDVIEGVDVIEGEEEAAENTYTLVWLQFCFCLLPEVARNAGLVPLWATYNM